MIEKPNILQILPALESGGVERGTVEIARALTQRGFGSYVVSSGGAMEVELIRAGTTHITLPVQKRDPISIWRNIAQLQRVIKEHNIKLVHARSRAPAWSAYYAAKRCGIPFVTTFHGFYGMEGRFKRYYNSVMARSAKVIAISHFIRDYILRYYPECASDDIEIIHRGADLALFNPQAVSAHRISELSTKWNLTEEPRPVILLPGRLTRIKGHRLLIKALSRIRDREFVALFVGSSHGRDSYVQELENTIIKSGLEGRVRFVGKTPHMTEAYALADIIVVPTTIPEAFGRVPVEAQAMGKLVIAADHGGAQETIINGETGFLVPPNDSDALARQIDAVLKLSDEKRARISTDAMQHVRQHFSITQMQEKTLAVYESLL